jgi:hypothetical protein
MRLVLQIQREKLKTGEKRQLGSVKENGRIDLISKYKIIKNINFFFIQNY